MKLHPEKRTEKNETYDCEEYQPENPQNMSKFV